MSSHHPGDLFSGYANEYAAFRPAYPEALIRYISQLVPYRGVVWDCGCGSGQLAVPLARYFNLVMATDISEKQIAQAPGHRGILYTVQAAEQTDFPDAYFDVIVVGQALHWFNHEAFFREANRLLGPDGVIVAIGYGLLTISPDVDKVVQHLYHDITGPFWAPGRRHLDAGYATIPWPFEPIETPAFNMVHNWTLSHMTGYLNTWSAVRKYEAERAENPINLIYDDLKKAWGEADKKQVVFPVILKAGRKLYTLP